MDFDALGYVTLSAKRVEKACFALQEKIMEGRQQKRLALMDEELAGLKVDYDIKLWFWQWVWRWLGLGLIFKKPKPPEATLPDEDDHRWTHLDGERFRACNFLRVASWEAQRKDGETATMLVAVAVVHLLRIFEYKEPETLTPKEGV